MDLVLPPCLEIHIVCSLLHLFYWWHFPQSLLLHNCVLYFWHFRLPFFSITIPLLNPSFKSYITFFISLMYLCSLQELIFFFDLFQPTYCCSVWDLIWLSLATMTIGLLIFFWEVILSWLFIFLVLLWWDLHVVCCFFGLFMPFKQLYSFSWCISIHARLGCSRLKYIFQKIAHRSWNEGCLI